MVPLSHDRFCAEYAPRLSRVCVCSILRRTRADERARVGQAVLDQLADSFCELTVKDILDTCVPAPASEVVHAIGRTDMRPKGKDAHCWTCAEVQYLLACGETLEQAIVRIGFRRDSLVAHMRRHGLGDLVAKHQALEDEGRTAHRMKKRTA